MPGAASRYCWILCSDLVSGWLGYGAILGWFSPMDCSRRPERSRSRYRILRIIGRKSYHNVYLRSSSILLVAKPRPTLATLLETATGSADQKIIEIEGRLRKSA